MNPFVLSICIPIMKLAFTAVSIAVISPAAVSGSPALPKGLSGMSSLGSMDSGGVETITGL